MPSFQHIQKYRRTLKTPGSSLWCNFYQLVANLSSHTPPCFPLPHHTLFWRKSLTSCHFTHEHVKEDSYIKPDVMAHAYNASTQKAEAGCSWVWSQSGLRSKSLSQEELRKNNNNKNPKCKSQSQVHRQNSKNRLLAQEDCRLGGGGWLIWDRTHYCCFDVKLLPCICIHLSALGSNAGTHNLSKLRVVSTELSLQNGTQIKSIRLREHSRRAGRKKARAGAMLSYGYDKVIPRNSL